MQVIPRLAIVVGLLGTGVLVTVVTTGAQEPSRAARPEIRLSGRVVDGASATPLRRARVSSADWRSESAFTDEQGRFEILLSGSSLRVSKPGYVPLTVEARALTSDTSSPTIRLDKGAAVTGMVFESSGVPGVGVRVRIREVDENPTGRGRPSQYRGAETDDRGEFRVGNLPAGRYLVDAGAGTRGRAQRGNADPANLIEGARGRGRGAPAPSALEGIAVDVRTGEEAAVALVLEGSVATPSAPVVRAARDAREAENPGSIRGRIVSADGAPVAGASVQATPVGGGARRAAAVSDAAGLYEIVGLSAGEYRLRVSRSGYSGIEYGQERALQQGKILRVNAGSRVQGIDVTMPRGGVVAGTVTDAWGEPLEYVDIEVMQAQYVGGRTRLTPAAGVQGRWTDDRGRYRVYGLLPGRYYLVASNEIEHAGLLRGAASSALGRGEDPFGDQVFYPGTSRLTEALPLDLGVGRDAIGIDVVYLPATGSRVVGTAMSAVGGAIRGRAVLGVSARYGAPLLPLRTVTVSADGSFEFANVAPGDYVVQVAGVSAVALEAERAALAGRARGAAGGRGGTGGRGRGGTRGGTTGVDDLREALGQAVLTIRAEREFGAQFVSVGGTDVTDVRVDMSPGSTIRGTLVFEGDGGSVQPSSFGFAALPSDPDFTPLTGERPPRAEVAADGTFALSGLTGPARFALTQAPAGWWLKSVDIHGVNAVTDPATFGRMEHSTDVARVVFASGAGRIEGQVTDERDQPVTEFAVIVLSSRPEHWFSGSPYVAFTTAAQDGSFRVARLPPGEYVAVAVDRIDGGADGGEWQRPEMLDSLAALGERLDIRQGQPITTTLRLIRLGL